MPFCSRLVGDVCFSDLTVGKRFICGAATYLVVKGSISFIRKYKFRNWLRARKVKHFKGKGYTNASKQITSISSPTYYPMISSVVTSSLGIIQAKMSQMTN